MSYSPFYDFLHHTRKPIAAPSNGRINIPRHYSSRFTSNKSRTITRRVFPISSTRADKAAGKQRRFLSRCIHKSGRTKEKKNTPLDIGKPHLEAAAHVCENKSF